MLHIKCTSHHMNAVETLTRNGTEPPHPSVQTMHHRGLYYKQTFLYRTRGRNNSESMINAGSTQSCPGQYPLAPIPTEDSTHVGKTHGL